MLKSTLIPALLALVLVQVAYSTLSIAADTRSNINAWLRQSKIAPKDAFMVDRVQMIFEDVKRANDNLVHPSKLFIIQSKGVPWAIALEDKNVILTSGAIDVIYSGNDSLAMKDARMAFVLGHELKHVIENDFSHERASNSFSATGVSNLLETVGSQSTNRKTLELLADEDGLITASLAGYDITAIFSEIGEASNFLEYWATQTNTRSNALHYSAKERIEYLRSSYRSINNLLEFFKYGVRLAHFGDHENARILFEDFYKVYESDRVLTNRGYAHLQLARAEMPEDVAYRYWYPDILETESGFQESPSRTIDNKLSIRAIEHLNKAVTLLTNGLNKSNTNKTAKLNLITAYLYLGEFSAARAVIEKIEGWENNSQLIGLDALVVMQNKRVKDPWNTYSLENLEKLAGHPAEDTNLLYNYARILSDNGREEDAGKFWSHLSSRLEELPRRYQIMVCRELLDKRSCFERAKELAVQDLSWRLKISPGDLINSKKVRSELKKWRNEPIKSYTGIDAEVYSDGEGNSLLVIDGAVKLVTLKQHGIDFEDELLVRYGDPQNIIETGLNEIWSYGPQWSALVSGNQVREIWIAE